MRTGKLNRYLKEQNKAVGHLVLSRDGKLLVTVGMWSDTLSLIDFESDEVVGTFTLKNKATISSCALSPDGKTLAITVEKYGIILWDVSTGGVLKELEGIDDGPAIQYAPDGKTIACGSIDSIRLLDATSGDVIWQFGNKAKRDSFYCGNIIAFSPDGQEVALGTYEGVIHILSAAKPDN